MKISVWSKSISEGILRGNEEVLDAALYHLKQNVKMDMFIEFKGKV